MQLLLVYDGRPDPERIRADAARILAEHRARQADAIQAERPWLTRVLADVAQERAVLDRLADVTR